MCANMMLRGAQPIASRPLHWDQPCVLDVPIAAVPDLVAPPRLSLAVRTLEDPEELSRWVSLVVQADLHAAEHGRSFFA